jgi:hypothetical protein
MYALVCQDTAQNMECPHDLGIYATLFVRLTASLSMQLFRFLCKFSQLCFLTATAAAVEIERSRGYRSSAAAAPLNSLASSWSWGRDNDGSQADFVTEPTSSRSKGAGGSGKRQEQVGVCAFTSNGFSKIGLQVCSSVLTAASGRLKPPPLLPSQTLHCTALWISTALVRFRNAIPFHQISLTILRSDCE